MLIIEYRDDRIKSEVSVNWPDHRGSIETIVSDSGIADMRVTFFRPVCGSPEGEGMCSIQCDHIWVGVHCKAEMLIVVLHELTHALHPETMCGFMVGRRDWREVRTQDLALEWFLRLMGAKYMGPKIYQSRML